MYDVVEITHYERTPDFRNIKFTYDCKQWAQACATALNHSIKTDNIEYVVCVQQGSEA